MTEVSKLIAILKVAMTKKTGQHIQERQKVAMDADKLITQAALYEILALAFLYPTDVLVDALTSGEYAEALEEITAALDTQSPEQASAIKELDTYTGKDPTAVLHELRQEHTRLYIGAPEPLVSPYAGVWQAKRDGVQPLLFVSKESMAVERFMRQCGVGQPEGTNEPLDHIGSELEFLQYLCLVQAGSAAPAKDVTIPGDAYEQFYTKHFNTWAQDFAKATIDNTKSIFFKSMGMIVFGSHQSHQNLTKMQS
jgi:TorA maturation chaperone TorD